MQTLLTQGVQLAAVTGIGGQGKTALAAEFLRTHAKGTDALYELGVWVDCRELPDSLHVKLIELLESLTGGAESSSRYREEKIEDTARRLVSHLRKRKCVLVFDNVDAYISESENAVGELKVIFDAVLDSDHQSLVILTCRPPMHDSRPTFVHLKLRGLLIREGKDFLVKRGVELAGHNSEADCEQLIIKIDGHPWWLGLIAGQIRSGHETIRSAVRSIGQGGVAAPGLIQDCFSGIWGRLGKDRQKTLRYLVESPKPLTDAEIIQAISTNPGPTKLAQEMRRLHRLGLIEHHEGQHEERTYDVHPLAREFVRAKFTTTEQLHYVTRILCIFLHPTVVQWLFGQANMSRGPAVTQSPLDVGYSIETCLTPAIRTRHWR